MPNTSSSSQPTDAVLCDVGMTVTSAWLAVQGFGMLPLVYAGASGGMVICMLYLFFSILVFGVRRPVTSVLFRKPDLGLRGPDVEKLRLAAVGILGLILLFQSMPHLMASWAQPNQQMAGGLPLFGPSGLVLLGCGSWFLLRSLRALRHPVGTNA